MLIKIIKNKPSIFCNHNDLNINLEINNRRETGKFRNVSKLNNWLLKNK